MNKWFAGSDNMKFFELHKNSFIYYPGEKDLTLVRSQDVPNTDKNLKGVC